MRCATSGPATPSSCTTTRQDEGNTHAARNLFHRHHVRRVRVVHSAAGVQLSIFDKFSVLDPAKMLREIDAETEGDTFTNLSILDQALARRQMHDAGIDVSNAAMLDPSLLLAELDVAIEADTGGGLTPTVLADFENATYTVSESPVALATLLAVDAVNWGGTYDASHVVENNGLSNDTGPVFAGGLLAAMVAGATLRMDIHVSAGLTLFMDFVDFPDWNTDWALNLHPDAPANLYNDDEDLLSAETMTVGDHIIAITVTPTHLALCVDGGTVVSAAVSAPASAWNAVGFNLLASVAGASFIRSFKVYDPIDDADLPSIAT